MAEVTMHNGRWLAGRVRESNHCCSPRRASTRSGSGWLGLFCFGAGVSPNKGLVDLNRSFGQRLFCSSE